MASAKLSPLPLSSRLLRSSLPPPFFSWGSPAFIKPPHIPHPHHPFSLQTQPCYPCQIHWRQPGEVNGANRFSAFTVELLRRGRQTQLKLPRTAQNIYNIFFHVRQKYIFLVKTGFKKIFFLQTFSQDLFRCDRDVPVKCFSP